MFVYIVVAEREKPENDGLYTVRQNAVEHRPADGAPTRIEKWKIGNDQVGVLINDDILSDVDS